MCDTLIAQFKTHNWEKEMLKQFKEVAGAGLLVAKAEFNHLATTVANWFVADMPPELLEFSDRLENRERFGGQLTVGFAPRV